jgi:hypothetical protein
MDLSEGLQDLWARKKAVERAIAELEQLQSARAGNVRHKRRGRKSMEPRERLEVSDRMKRYWANRRGPRECPPLAEAASLGKHRLGQPEELECETAQASPSRTYREDRLRSA